MEGSLKLARRNLIRDGKMIARFRFALGLSFLAVPAFADMLAAGDEIRAAISGNTVQGAIAGAYTEFYAADGTIKGKDYAGKWRVDADKMRFAYDKREADCWQVCLTGDQVAWVKDGTDDGNDDGTDDGKDDGKDDGNDDGTGTIVAGNPNGY